MDTNRIKRAAEWFYSTVFQDEAIRPRPQKPSAHIPAPLRTARSLAAGMPAYRQSRESVFVKQAMLLANYEDDFVYERPVFRYYPTYQSLTDEELRGYFSWRTKLRRGEVQKASLSYAFLYIYELLNQIGVADPMDGYRKLKDFQSAYGELDGAILPYLQKWLLEYVVYYELDPSLLADTPQVCFDRNLAVLAGLENHDSGEILKALAALTPRTLERSRFYREHQADMDAVVCRVLRRMAAHYSSRCKKPMTEQFFGAYHTVPVLLFESAVFFDRAKSRTFDFAVDAVRTYHCRNGFWSVQKYDCPDRPSTKLGKLVKTVDAVMRERCAYRYPIKRELDTKWIIKLIEEETQSLLAEKAAAQAKKVTIDFSRLSAIRQDALLTQDKLIVEEEAVESEIPEAAATETAESEIPQTLLTPEEYRLLQSLLYGRDLGWVRSSGLMLSVLADGINEKLFDAFSDSVLTLEDQPALVEDYIQDLKEMVHP